jgi:hypothetical protein
LRALAYYLMEDRIRAVIEEDSLDDDSRGIDFPQERATAKGGKTASVDKDEDDKKTIKIEMTNHSSSLGSKPVLQPPTSDHVSLKSKLKLSTRRRTQPDESTAGQTGAQAASRQNDDQQLRVKESLREFERLSMKGHNSRAPQSITRHTGLSTDLDQTRNFTPIDKKEKYFDGNSSLSGTPRRTGQDQELETSVQKNEFQLFYEKETNYTFWSFICSKDIPLLKKLANGYFLAVFICATAMSVVELVAYSDSSCKMELGTSIVYYIYFGLSMLMRFSFYIFLQLELHGKINYSLKVGYPE